MAARIVRDNWSHSCRGHYSERSSACAGCDIVVGGPGGSCKDETRAAKLSKVKGLMGRERKGEDSGVDARRTKPCSRCRWERRAGLSRGLDDKGYRFSKCGNKAVFMEYGNAYCSSMRDFSVGFGGLCGMEGKLWEPRQETAFERLGKALRTALRGPGEAKVAEGAGGASKGLKMAFLEALRGPGKGEGL